MNSMENCKSSDTNQRTEEVELIWEFRRGNDEILCLLSHTPKLAFQSPGGLNVKL